MRALHWLIAVGAPRTALAEVLRTTNTSMLTSLHAPLFSVQTQRTAETRPEDKVRAFVPSGQRRNPAADRVGLVAAFTDDATDQRQTIRPARITIASWMANPVDVCGT